MLPIPLASLPSVVFRTSAGSTTAGRQDRVLSSENVGRTTCIVIHFIPCSLFQFFHVFLNGRHAPLPRRMESELLHGLINAVLLDEPGLIAVFQVQSPVLQGFGLATQLVASGGRSTDLSH